MLRSSLLATAIRTTQPLTQRATQRSMFTSTNVGLDSIVDMSKLSQESTDRIKEIWMEYHKTKDGISAVIPTDTYKYMKSRALATPNFVIPMPKDKGFINAFFQAQGNTMLFTSLAKYKTIGQNADPWLTIRNFVEFEDRGIVLMRGELGADINSLEAQYLYNQIRLHLFDESKYKLMMEFNSNPAAFDFDKMVSEMSALGGIADSLSKK